MYWDICYDISQLESSIGPSSAHVCLDAIPFLWVKSECICIMVGIGIPTKTFPLPQSGLEHSLLSSKNLGYSEDLC